ncbi:hypothetical protein [Streptomyces sp. CL12-4]|uniref:hypothetical protein n=1 Tax=Streptomyces sp. CL12-4 TaxID=2810306 RepID=UPI001EFA6A9C|nr:hypothetical protein [Streptomyces sp. CL12-4]MCG8971737.1 hypothetical protein [Streptomyces sp. CL12-4]
MANFLDDQTDAKRLAQLLADYDRRLQALERSTQAGYTSIEGGSLDIYDDEGVLKGSVGVQPDGGVALVPVNTTPPPTPTPPAVGSELAGLAIVWDGLWDDSYETPTDFALVQVHVGAAADFTPELATQVATITAPLGGSVTVHIDHYEPVWVRLVAQNTAAIVGPASVAVQGQARQAVGQDLVDGIVTEVKLAEDAVTEAKIALGAVGSTALADGAVLEDKLAKAAVSLGKIADGAVTINALGGALSDSAAQRYVDAMGDPAAWKTTAQSAGATWEHLTGVTDAPTGQTVGQAKGYVREQGTTLVPYEPGTLYRISARVRLTAATSGTDTFYVGVAGIGADKVTLVNRDGANSTNSHYYSAASGRAINVADGWVTVVGYLKDRAPAGTPGTAGPNPDPRAAGMVHQDVRFIAPYVWANFASQNAAMPTSVMQVDAVTIEALKTGLVDSTNFVAGSVTTAALATDSVTAGKVAADAISARELKANSVTAEELAAGSVTAQAVAAGSITADKMTIVGSPNVLPDPSFEGAGGAAIAARQTYLSQDKTFGNGSPASLKIDAVSAAAADRSAELTLLPVTAGDQLYIACDYYASTDWAGAEINLQVRWEKADGTVLSYGKLSTTAPAKGAWARFADTVTAPAGATQGRVRVESGGATAGAVWFDNAAVRPVVPGVQIADGAITAPKILAGAVTTAKLDALAVTAEKIAALAITTAKLDALAVTADKLAANSVTATKILAGTIDATHIKAGSLTTDRLTVGLAGSLGQKFYDSGSDAALWRGNGSSTTTAPAVPNLTSEIVSDAQSGGYVMRGVGLVSAVWRPDILIPYDPNVLYRVTVTVRQTAASSVAGTQRFYAGVAGVAADRTTLVNNMGGASSSSAHWVAANNVDLVAGAGWTRFTGYIKGYAPAGQSGTTAARPQPTSPGVLHASARYITPVFYLNYLNGTGTAEVDMVTVEAVETGAVNTVNIADGAVTANKIMVGGVGPAQLGLGTDGNLISDPSFEGAVSAQRVATLPAWSVVDGGNGTAKALRVNAATPSEIPLVGPIPAMPGQKMFLAVDYLASADWAGDQVRIVAEWRNSSGTALGLAQVTSGSGTAVKGAWTRLVGLGDTAAPTGTTEVVVRLASVTSTAGSVLWDNAVARFVTASTPDGARAELSPLGLQLFDETGEEAVALVTGRPNYLTLSTGGLPVATIDQDGGAGFQRLAVAEGLTVGGTDWTELLNQAPRGIQAIDYQVSPRTASGTEMGYVELACEIDESRMYRIVFCARANPSVAGGELQIRLRDGGAGTPTITSPQKYISVTHMPLGNSFTCRMEHVVNGSGLGAGLHRYLITFVNAFGPSGQTCEMTGSSDSAGYFYIEDVGPRVPETGGYNDGGGTTTPPPRNYTKYYNCAWSGSYARRGSYSSYFGNSCYQGYYSSTNGTLASLIGFPASLGTDLAGATINRAEVYLYFDHWYANAGGKAVIKAHSHTSRPATFSSDAEGKTVSWARNEGKWVDITSVFDSTKWRGIALDPNSTASTYYGRARGFGQTNPPRLKVSYTK